MVAALILVLVFIVALIATLLSSMSGGGAAIIAVPVWLSLGFPFALSNAIQQVSSAFWVLPAARNYLHGTKINWRFLILFSALGLIGVFFGITFILAMSQRILEIIIGMIIIILVVFTFFKKDFGTVKKKITSSLQENLAYPFALLMGFYESIFGSGNGIFFSAATIYTRGFVLTEALGYYYAVAFAWTVVASVLLISKGYYDVPIMISAAVGSVVGGYIGSKFAVRKGNRFIKLIFCVIGFILGMKLLLGL